MESNIRDTISSGSNILVGFGYTCCNYIGCFDRGIPFFSDRYSTHVKTLITIIYDRTSSRYGSGDYSGSHPDHFPRELSGSIFAKRKLIQHFYTYQKFYNNKLYDEYRRLAEIQNNLNQLYSKVNNSENPYEKQKMNKEIEQLQLEQKDVGLKFKDSFSEINSKTMMDSNPVVGACNDCLKYTGMKYSRYAKWLKDKKKKDPNAWDDSKW